MPVIQDEEFGAITVRRSAKSTQVRLRVGPDGTLRASLPLYAPLFLVKRLVRNSRIELRSLLQQAQPNTTYYDGMLIGKSHSLQVRPGGALRATRHGQQIILTLPEQQQLNSTPITRVIRDAVIDALRIEAKNYLPRRLKYLADQFGLSYSRVRFSHASSRWGSCSSNGTISLNIALMKLPFELIDYVIVHELAHTVEMNHSPEFWNIVSQGDPDYKEHRRALKKENPML